MYPQTKLFFWLLIIPFLSNAQAPIVGIADVANNFNSPVSVTNAGDGSNRLFVTEQGGTIKIVQNGMHLNVPFLDISSLTCISLVCFRTYRNQRLD